MKKQLALYILLFCCISCISQKKEVIAKSSIKLEGKNTNIRNLLDINGYYALTPDQKNLGNIMFFEDGSWVYFHFERDATDSDIKNNLSKSIDSWCDNKLIRWGNNWGVYTIKNDTVILHNYDKGSLWGNSWSLSESRCKIIDRRTIKNIYSKSLMKLHESSYKENSPWLDGVSSHFIPADSLPSPDCWLKEEKWIWRNESDWKDYMKKIEQIKKKYKKD